MAGGPTKQFRYSRPNSYIFKKTTNVKVSLHDFCGSQRLSIIILVSVCGITPNCFNAQWNTESELSLHVVRYLFITMGKTGVIDPKFIGKRPYRLRKYDVSLTV